MSELRILRDRLAGIEAADAAGRVPAPGADGKAVLIQTKAVGTYPTAPASFFIANVLRADGPETEGAAASFTPTGASLAAYNLGSKTPPAGSRHIAHSAGGRWVFRHDG